MGILKYFGKYIGAIVLAVIIIIVYLLAQLPFSLWLPGYTLLPEWLWDRNIFMLIGSYSYYIFIPACLLGIVIFYFKVLKNI